MTLVIVPAWLAAFLFVLSNVEESLAPGAVYATYNPNKADLPNGYKGGAVITSTGGKIVALVNEQLGAGDQPGDVLFTFACSNI